MTSSELRAKAREKLSGKWGKAIGFIFAYFLISLLLSIVAGLFEKTKIASIISLAVSIIEVPLSFGFIASFYKLYTGEEVGAFDFLSYSFSNFGKAWAIALRTALKLLLPLVLYIVSILVMIGTIAYATLSANTVAMILGLLSTVLIFVSLVWFITKSYYYTMSYYIAFDEPELTAKEAVEKSKELMTNNRSKLFCLQFSFIGWMILASFTLGIGLLWLVPYMMFAEIAFYHFVAKKGETVEVETTTDNTENNTEA